MKTKKDEVLELNRKELMVLNSLRKKSEDFSEGYNRAIENILKIIDIKLTSKYSSDKGFVLAFCEEYSCNNVYDDFIEDLIKKIKRLKV